MMEALGQLVMEASSLEGAAVVQGELEELTKSWKALRQLEESLLRREGLLDWSLVSDNPPSQQGVLSHVPRAYGWGSAVCQAWCQAPPGIPRQF